MKVTPYVLKHPLAMTDPNRGKGLHASDIYGDFFKKLNPKKYAKNDIDEAQLDLLYAIGLAWEQYLEKVLLANGELCARPGELVVDEPNEKGILEPVKYSPDLLIVNGQDRIGEIKATYQSVRTCKPGDKNFEKYLAQNKLYCYWTEIPYSRFYVLYLHGDWRRQLIAFKAWNLEYTSRELKDNHRMMMNHARDENLFALHRAITRRKR